MRSLVLVTLIWSAAAHADPPLEDRLAEIADRAHVHPRMAEHQVRDLASEVCEDVESLERARACLAVAAKPLVESRNLRAICALARLGIPGGNQAICASLEREEPLRIAEALAGQTSDALPKLAAGRCARLPGCAGDCGVFLVNFVEETDGDRRWRLPRCPGVPRVTTLFALEDWIIARTVAWTRAHAPAADRPRVDAALAVAARTRAAAAQAREPAPERFVSRLAAAAAEPGFRPRERPIRSLRHDCEEAGACNPDSSEAEVRAYTLRVAARVRPQLTVAQRDDLDCALGRLGWRPRNARACDRSEARFAPKLATWLREAQGDQRLVLAAAGCAELAGCAGPCGEFLHMFPSADPATRYTMPRCAGAPAGGSPAALDAWILARVVKWMQKAAPLLDAEGRATVSAAARALAP